MSFAKQLRTFGLAAVAAAGLVSCSISKPECTVGATTNIPVGLTGTSAFAVRYIEKGAPTGTCDGFTPFKGDMVGMQTYHPDTGKKERDFTKTAVAIRTQSLGELQWMTEDLGVPGDIVQANSLGDFTDVDPNSEDLCEAKTLSPAQVIFEGTTFPSDAAYYPLADDTLPETCAADSDCNANVNAVCTPDGVCGVAPECMADLDCNAVDTAVCVGADPASATPGFCAVPVDLPKTDLKYEWSNVQFLVTAAAVGTQFMADLKITLNGCVAEYRAVGVWPSVDCTTFDPEATSPGDDALCNPEPDADNGRPIGSGINPDFGPIACDTEIAVAPIVDAWYSIPDIFGAPISVPRCVITQDTIPALEGFKSTSTASQ